MWRSHASLGEAVIIGTANIICRRQTSFKKRTFVGRQKCVFCWRRERDSNPRGIAPKLISSQPRYDHFDISAYLIVACLQFNMQPQRNGSQQCCEYHCACEAQAERLGISAYLIVACLQFNCSLKAKP